MLQVWNLYICNSTIVAVAAAGLDLSVYGAGLAATLSTWVSCITLIGLMLRRKVLDPADLASPPTRAEVVPYLWKGAVLAFRMIVTFGEETNLLQQPAVHRRIGH
jgi:Na+-driven multidrug efflux pump